MRFGLWVLSDRLLAYHEGSANLMTIGIRLTDERRGNVVPVCQMNAKMMQLVPWTMVFKIRMINMRRR